MADETKTNAAYDAADKQDAELSDQELDSVAGGANTANFEGVAGGQSTGAQANPGGGSILGKKKRGAQSE